MKRFTLFCLWFCLFLSATSLADDYLKQLDAWHAKRISKLASEDGYLTLSGLHWVRDKVVNVPGFGTAALRDGKIVLWVNCVHGADCAECVSTVLDPELPEGEHRVRKGTRSAYAIKRGPWIGIRVKDSQAPARTGFQGVERFPVERDWILKGELVPADEQVAIESVVGVATQEASPGWAQFQYGGKTYKARLIGAPEDEKFFLVFSDASAGKTTYPACRFLTVEREGEAGLVLDFNKAINPACAFSRYATCPLPPEENVFPFSIEVG